MKGKDLNKKKKDEEIEEDEAGEGEDEAGEDNEKSESLSEDDLEKSLTQLEAAAAEGDSASRKDSLLKKAQEENLDKSEQDELYQLLGGEPAAEESLADEVVKGFAGNEELTKALDVSEYLQEQHGELTKSLGILADYIEKGENRQHQFNLILAKAVSETGRLAKGMAERLGVIEEQPARQPKAMRSAAQPLEKGFAGNEAGEDLTKGAILDAMGDMLRKSVDAGHSGVTEDGIDLNLAASKFEQLGTIHPKLLGQVKAHLSGQTVH